MVARYKDAFGLFADNYGQGSITSSNIGSVLRAAGLDPTDYEIETMNDRAGQLPIDFNKFITLVTGTKKKEIEMLMESNLK